MCPLYGELHRNVTRMLREIEKEEEKDMPIPVSLQMCSHMQMKRANMIHQQMTEERKDTTMKIELKDTVDMMLSPDHRERFKAEYWQLKNRYDSLHHTCVKYEAGTLEFTPKCDIELLKKQKALMGNYLNILEIRAEIENIPLGGDK